jgi:hypothetical protein
MSKITDGERRARPRSTDRSMSVTIWVIAGWL